MRQAVLPSHDREPALRDGAVARDANVHPRVEAAARIRQEHDVRLEPLRLVQVHEPHDIPAAGLEWE